jgi:Tfp pilus assembly protein PilF
MIGSNDNVHRSGWRRARAAVLFLLGYAALAAVVAAPVVPQDPQSILERLPPRDGAVWDEIRALHLALAENPADAQVAANLARSYLALNRGVGDPRLVAYASRALARWDGDAAPPVDVALERALIAQTEHRFDAARAELAALLERAPRSAQAWLALAALDTVQGRYADAKRSCTRLVLLQDPVVAGACLAAVQTTTGEAAAAYRFLTETLARPQTLDAETSAWLATLAAETAEGLDLHEDAERHFRAALAASEPQPSIYLLTAYADFLLRRGRPAAVIELLDEAPPADSLWLRLALAEARTGRRAAERLVALRYRLELALRGDERAHAREAAYFALYLDYDAPRALVLALDNWTVQREPIDARLVLEAAAAAGSPSAAQLVRDWLLSHGVAAGEPAASSTSWGAL